MRMMDMARRMALLSLALLPPVSAAVYIALYAKDGLEVASAMMAVAGVICLANLFQVALLARENRTLAAKQEDTRRQALALARLMRDLNQRMSQVEIDPEHPVHPAASAPRRAAPAMPKEAPAQDRRIVSLPHRRLAGIEPATPADATAPFRRLGGGDDLGDRLEAVERTIARGVPHGVFVLLAGELPLSATPELIRRIEQLADEDPGFADTFLLGISQTAIRRGGAEEAAVLARLARAGIRFMLTAVGDFNLDAGALAACNISHVRIDAHHFAGSEEELAQLADRLGAGGIAVVAEHVDSPRMIPELIDCGIRLASGAAFEAVQDGSQMPWRAGPAKGRPLSARAEDSIRFRATG